MHAIRQILPEDKKVSFDAIMKHLTISQLKVSQDELETTLNYYKRLSVLHVDDTKTVYFM